MSLRALKGTLAVTQIHAGLLNEKNFARHTSTTKGKRSCPDMICYLLSVVLSGPKPRSCLADTLRPTGSVHARGGL